MRIPCLEPWARAVILSPAPWARAAILSPEAWARAAILSPEPEARERAAVLVGELPVGLRKLFLDKLHPWLFSDSL